MFANPRSVKRFPTACRFFSQGNCREGEGCLFAHILPLLGTPNNESHAVVFGDAFAEQQPMQHQSASFSSDSHSLQKAIRDLEIDQLEKKFRPHFHQTSSDDAYTIAEIALPLPDNTREIQLHLTIPRDYPDSQCSISIQNTDIDDEHKRYIQNAFEANEWHQMRHMTIIQQLDWLSSTYSALLNNYQEQQ